MCRMARHDGRLCVEAGRSILCVAFISVEYSVRETVYMVYSAVIVLYTYSGRAKVSILNSV